MEIKLIGYDNEGEPRYEVSLSGWTWGFQNKGEAELAVAMWRIADAKGMDINQFRHCFAMVLRGLGETKSVWATFSPTLKGD